MELDTKQKVLVALYTEYQKDLPNMESVNHEVLGIGEDVFNVAVLKLQNEGYVNGVLDVTSLDSEYPEIMTHRLKLTRDGINYVETKLKIDPTLSGNEKVRNIFTKLGEWGLVQAKDIVAKIGSEYIKGII